MEKCLFVICFLRQEYKTYSLRDLYSNSWFVWQQSPSFCRFLIILWIFFFHSLHLSRFLRALWQQPLVLEPIVPVLDTVRLLHSFFSVLWIHDLWKAPAGSLCLRSRRSCSSGGLLISCPLHRIIVIPIKATTFRLVRSYCWGNHLSLRKSDCANGTGKGAPGFAKPWEAQGLELRVWRFPATRSWWDLAWSSCAWPSPGTWPFSTLNVAISWVL